MKITALCMSSTIQRTAVFERLCVDEVNRSVRYRLDASGKAVNAARVLNQLEKGCVTLICPAGKENKAEFSAMAKKDGLKPVIIAVPGRVRECCTLLDRESGRTTELVMDEPDLAGEADKKAVLKAEKRLISAVQKALKTSDALLFAGTSPKIWAPDLKTRICKTACNKGRILLVDFWGKELLNVLDECTPAVIKINAKEFCGTFGLSASCSDAELTDAVCAKSRELQNCIVITRGKDSTIASFCGEAFSHPVERVKAVNPIGCGDSFSSGFLYEYLKTSFSHGGKPDIAAALAKGTYCAARNAECEKVGTLYEV